MTHRRVFPYAEHFAASLVASLRPEWRAALDAFVAAEFGGGRGRKARKTIGVHFRFGNGERFGRQPANNTHVTLRTAAARAGAGMLERRYGSVSSRTRPRPRLPLDARPRRRRP